MTKQHQATAAHGQQQTSLLAVGRRGSRGEGPNWVMLAGGAIVMALSLVLGRKQLQKERARDEESVNKKKNRPQPANQLIYSGLPLKPSSPSSLAVAGPCGSKSIKTDITIETTEEKHVQADDDAHEDRTCSSVISHLQLQSFSSECIRDNQQSALPLSPPSSPKSTFCLEKHGLQQTLPVRIERFQLESYTSSALRAGLSAKAGMVQTLRQQIKTQDGIIFDLQAQLTDQDQVIAIYHAHIMDLHERLDVTRKEKMDPNCGDCRSCHAESSCVTPARTSENSGKEENIYAVLLQARKLEEEVKSLTEEKMKQEIASQAMNIQHESLVQKVIKMETELKEAKMLATQKQDLIQKYECECFNYQIALEELQHRLDAETLDNEFLRTTKVIGFTDTSSANTTWKWSESLEPPKSTNTHDEEISSKCCTVVDNGDSSHYRGGNVMRSYNVLFSSNSHPLGSNNISSSSRGGSRSTTGGGAHGATTSKGMVPLMGISDREFTDDATNNDAAISEKLLTTLQQEVEQVTAALAAHWKVVSEKQEETSCIVSEFQKRSAVNTTEMHEAESLGAAAAQDWRDLSYSPGDMSAAQVQELSHKLEQIAKKQRVDEDLMELTKHQVKIAELKQQVSKLTSKCHVWSIAHSSPHEEGTCDHWHEGPGVSTSLVFDLADKLAEQEEQAKQMSIEVQRLSASFQLSSPYVPKSKKEELRKLFQGDDMLQGHHHESSNRNQRTESSDLRSAKPRYAAFQEEELEENCSGLPDGQFSLTSLKQVDAGNGRNEDVELWCPIMAASSSKLGRRAFTNGAKKSIRSLQNPCPPPVYDVSKSDLQQDVREFSKCNSLLKSDHHQQQPVHIKFSPEEVTSRFSFRTARNTVNPDNIVGNSGPNNDVNFRPLVLGSTFDKDITVAFDSPEVASNAPPHDCLSVSSKPPSCVQGGEGGSSCPPSHSRETVVLGFDGMGDMEAEIKRLQREIEQVMVETSVVADIRCSPNPGQNFPPKFKENLSPVFSAKYAPFFSDIVSPLSDHNSPVALPRKKTTPSAAFPDQKSYRLSPASDERFSSVSKESQMAFDASTNQKWSSPILSERMTPIPMSRMLLGEKKFVDLLDGSISSSMALLDERSSSSPAFNDQLSSAFDTKTSPAVRVGSPTISGSVTPRFFGRSEAADGTTSLRRSLFKSNRNSLSGDSLIPCLNGNNDDD